MGTCLPNDGAEPALVTHAHGHDYVGFRQAPPAGTLKAREQIGKGWAG